MLYLGRYLGVLIFWRTAIFWTCLWNIKLYFPCNSYTTLTDMLFRIYPTSSTYYCYPFVYHHTGYFKTYTNSSNFKSVCPWHTIILLTYLFRIFMIFLSCNSSSEQSACSKNWNNLQLLSRSNQGVSETQSICHLWICVGFNIAWVHIMQKKEWKYEAV